MSLPDENRKQVYNEKVAPHVQVHIDVELNQVPEVMIPDPAPVPETAPSDPGPVPETATVDPSPEPEHAALDRAPEAALAPAKPIQLHNR